MKIVHVVNDLDTGGAQTLIEALIAPGEDEFSVVCLSSPGELSSRVEALAPVTYLGYERDSRRVFQLISDVRASLNSLRPDVVHSHLVHADFAVAVVGFRRNWAHVSTVHTTGLGNGDSARSRILGRTVAMLSRRFDAVVACGDRARAYMSHYRFDSRRSYTIRNGVPLSPNLSERSAESARVLMLARWHPMKDHRNALEAVAELRRKRVEVWLDLAGHGVTPSNTELVGMIEDLGISDRVTLHGAVMDVRPHLSRSSCLLISSAYGEALPMAGLEALAAGTPVITTDVGDCGKLAVRPWQVVQPSNPTALAAALTRILSLSPQEHQSLRRDSYARAAADYSIEDTRREYRTLYLKVRAGK